MSETDSKEAKLLQRAVQIGISNHVSTCSELTPEPIQSSSNSRAALRRCRAAWQRAFDAYLSERGSDSSLSRMFAADKASPAYCAAMPPLDSLENIRDFVACAAHGILIGAIPAKREGAVLYAAQVALSLVQYQEKTSADAQKRRTPPTPIEKLPSSKQESVAS